MAIYADFLAVMRPYVLVSNTILSRFISDDIKQVLDNLPYTVPQANVSLLIDSRAQLDTHMSQLLEAFNKTVEKVNEQLSGNSTNTTDAVTRAFLPIVSFFNDLSTTITIELINQPAWRGGLDNNQAKLLIKMFCKAINAGLIKQWKRQQKAMHLNTWLTQEDTLEWLSYEINKHSYDQVKVTLDDILIALTTEDYSHAPSEQLLIHFYKLKYWKTLSNYNAAFVNKIEGSLEYNELLTHFHQLTESIYLKIKSAHEAYVKFLGEQEKNLQLIRSSSSRNTKVTKLTEKLPSLSVDKTAPAVEENLIESESSDDGYDEIGSISEKSSKRASDDSPVVGSGSSDLTTIFPSDSPSMFVEQSPYSHVSFLLNKEIKKLFQLNVSESILKISQQALKPSHKSLFNFRLALNALTPGSTPPQSPHSRQATPHTPTTPSTSSASSETVGTSHASGSQTPSSGSRIATPHTPHTASVSPRSVQESISHSPRKEFIIKITSSSIALGFVAKPSLLPNTKIYNGIAVSGLRSLSQTASTASVPNLFATASKQDVQAVDPIQPMADGQADDWQPTQVVKRSNSFSSLTQAGAHLVNPTANVAVPALEPSEPAAPEKAKRKGRLARFLDFVKPGSKSQPGTNRHKP